MSARPVMRMRKLFMFLFINFFDLKWTHTSTAEHFNRRFALLVRRTRKHKNNSNVKFIHQTGFPLLVEVRTCEKEIAMRDRAAGVTDVGNDRGILFENKRKEVGNRDASIS